LSIECSRVSLLQQTRRGRQKGEHFDFAGRLSRSVFDEIGIPRDADSYLCGPSQFMADMKEALAALGIAPQRIHAEIFGGDNSKTLGVSAPRTRLLICPRRKTTPPSRVVARSGSAAYWNASKYQSILELAEACDAPSLWSCRTGVCVTTARAAWFPGQSSTDPSPSKSPPTRTYLFAVSQPVSNVVIDL
jgi:hypothetical protein